MTPQARTGDRRAQGGCQMRRTLERADETGRSDRVGLPLGLQSAVRRPVPVERSVVYGNAVVEPPATGEKARIQERGATGGGTAPTQRAGGDRAPAFASLFRFAGPLR